MAVQAVALAIIGFVPASVPHNYVTVPISFLAAVQIGLLRSIGDLAYLPVRRLWRAHPRVRLGCAGRRLCQPGMGCARDLAACRLPCSHPVSVHHR
jgi:hypothetical protein